MTKTEYEEEKAKILAEHGKPEYDMGDPVNEAARKVALLKGSYLRSLKKGPKEAKPLELEAESALKTGQKSLSFTIPAQCEPEFNRFSTEEQGMIVSYFSNYGDSAAKIASSANVTRQKLAAFLKSENFLIFKQRVLLACKDDLLFPALLGYRESLLAANDATRYNASKAVLEEEGLIRSDKVEKPDLAKLIDDPEADRMLKELGDRLVFDRVSLKYAKDGL